ncbi:MAG: 16S rRNA (guanine(527)-N(7))-methyltransferase RsmG [Pseudomonadota bacterium]
MRAYSELLLKWNRVYNLTAVRDPEKIITHHLLDSLAVLPYVEGPRVVDVGAGAGLPGIPLAIAAPSLQITLIESNQKKCAFLTQVRVEIGLGNVAVACQRVQDHRSSVGFNTLICRAFSSISEFLAGAAPLCADGGVMLAMKGVYPAEALRSIPAGLQLEAVRALQVPGLGAERHLVIVRKPAAAAA